MEIVNTPSGFYYSGSDEVGPTFEEMTAEVQQLPDNPAPVESGSSFISSDYWRGKIAEFQSTMNAADSVYQAVQAAMFTEGAIQSQSVWDGLMQSLAEYDAKKTLIRTTAEAVNLGVSAVNALGGNLPALRLPGSLGALPAIPLVAIAALSTAAVLVAWGREWIAGVNSRLRMAQALDAQATPEARAALAATLAKTEAAERAADASTLGALAPLAKWAALGLLGFLAWRAFDRYGGRGKGGAA